MATDTSFIRLKTLQNVATTNQGAYFKCLYKTATITECSNNKLREHILNTKYCAKQQKKRFHYFHQANKVNVIVCPVNSATVNGVAESLTC